MERWSRVRAVVVVVLTGCSHVSYVPSGNVAARPPKAKSELRLFFDLDEPNCKYDVVGFYQARTDIDPMAIDAAERGVDGLVNIKCAPPGTVGAGACSAKAYVCR